MSRRTIQKRKIQDPIGFLALASCILPSYNPTVKGVITAGGLGKRLYPLTKITNKHLLPVYDRPMIFYPLEKMVEAGIDDVLIVTGGNGAGDFLRLLGNGRDLGLRRLNYTYQEGEGGIAAALLLAEDVAEGGSILVILGDNIFEDSLRAHVESFEEAGVGARIFLKAVDDPREYGVVEVADGRVVSIEEKPTHPKSNLAQTGIYMYDRNVFGIIKALRPSARGELEITDVNRAYLAQGKLSFVSLPGFWADAGDSIESYFLACAQVRSRRGPRGH